MKELSIEEKARRYDGAIKRLEDIETGKCQKTFMFTEGLFDYIFPELKESKDERIRKGIILNLEYLADRAEGFVKDELKERIAWLEKLKVFAEHGDGLYYFGNNGFTYVGNPTCDNVSRIERQVEQKPADWTEDRRKELSLSLQIQAYLSTASDELYAKGKPIYSEERLEDIHKCMLMWQKLHNAYFYHNPVEWSEEDEKIISDAEVWLDTLCDFLKDSSSAYIPNVRVIISKLKSLKDRVQPQPQSQWKPSDEQMNALNDVISSRDIKYDVLSELWNDLNKLREEQL